MYAVVFLHVETAVADVEGIVELVHQIDVAVNADVGSGMYVFLVSLAILGIVLLHPSKSKAAEVFAGSVALPVVSAFCQGDVALVGDVQTAVVGDVLTLCLDTIACYAATIGEMVEADVHHSGHGLEVCFVACGEDAALVAVGIVLGAVGVESVCYLVADGGGAQNSVVVGIGLRGVVYRGNQVAGVDEDKVVQHVVNGIGDVCRHGCHLGEQDVVLVRFACEVFFHA